MNRTREIGVEHEHNRTKHYRLSRTVPFRTKHPVISPLRDTYHYLVRPPPPIRCVNRVLMSFRSQSTLHTHTRPARKDTTASQAHESPVLFYSVVLGPVRPVLAFGVSPIRECMCYRPPEPIPNTYPSAFLHRPIFQTHLGYTLGVCSPEAPKTTCAGLRGRGVKGRHECCVQAQPKISICPRRRKRNLGLFFPFFSGRCTLVCAVCVALAILRACKCAFCYVFDLTWLISSWTRHSQNDESEPIDLEKRSFDISLHEKR